MDPSSLSFSILYAPSSKVELAVFYLAWISLYLGIHIIWDICSKHTPSFRISSLKSKIDVAYSGTTFATSLLLGSALVFPKVFEFVGDVTLPIVIAVISGVLTSVSGLEPRQH